MMRSYMVSYFAEGCKGRVFVDTQSDDMVSREAIEAWEKVISEQYGFSKVCISGFFEIASPSLSEE